MDDREKILAWLNCYCQGNDNPDCGNCPFQYGDCAVELPKAIKNLLQEPVKPTRDAFDRCYCGNCDEMLRIGANFCHNCGRKVKKDV